MGLPALIEFENHEVRMVERDGEPWWVLPDLCRALEHSNPTMAASALDPDEKGLSIIETPGGPQEMTIISEPGLYALLRSSRKPWAKRFDRHVRHEILPSIRKTGIYGSQVPEVAQQIIVGLKEALAPLAIRFDGQDRAIERVEARVDGIAEDIASIKARMLNSRRRINEEDKREHVDATSCLGGRCPCCSLAMVVENGIKTPFSEFDHFYQANRPDADHTWLICKPCHTEFTTGRVSRPQREAEFRAYQQKRLRLPGRQTVLFG